MKSTIQTQVDPSKIMQVGTGFFATKTLLTAVNMRLFTFLAASPRSGQEIKEELGLHSRSLYDFLDALVALGFLNRTGIKETSVYSNTEDSDLFLDKNKPSYIGGILEMANNRLYPFWDNLEVGLKTGLPQNETKNNGESLFETIYTDTVKLREFIHAMTGVQMGNFIAFGKQFDFSNYKTLCDIGGSGGTLSAQVILNNGHMKCTTYDLPPVEPIVKENLENMGLTEKVTIASGDFFTDNFPKADVITMGNILHDWGTADKKMLIKKAYDALPQGGALVVIENIIDADRKKNSFGLLMSLNMLIETQEGYDFSIADFEEMTKDVGFGQISIMPLTGSTSAAIAIK